MAQSSGPQSGDQRAPLQPGEAARAELNFVPYVAQALTAHGRFRVSAGTPDMVELFQGVARRVGDQLGRPVISYSNGRETVITFGVERDGELDGSGPRRRQVT